jgi:phage terminase large subunit
MPDIEIQLPHQFQWRSYQKGLFTAFDKGINRFFIVWHRRAGKDKACLNFMICRAMERTGSYYYLLPTYTQVKKIIWDGMDASGFKFMDHIPPELIARKNESELKVELINGSIIQLLGTDNIDRIVGVNPVGVVFSEYSLQDPRAYDFYRPILNENKGWALFNGTPRGKNHFFKLYESIKTDPTWYNSILTIDDTHRDGPGEDGGPVVTTEMVDQDRREGMDDDLIQQEYYCNFAGVQTGSYYGALMVRLEEDGRLCDVPWNPRLPVFTVWDLGIADAMTVIFAQNDGQMVNIIDYIEKRGEGLGYFSAEVNRKSYVYSNHYAPHDITSRELTSGKTRLELARDLGLDFRIAPNIAVQDGIDSLRSLFPKLRIDRSKCARLADCLRSYHKLWDPKNQEYGKTPVHDWSSHGADAARYMSLVYDLEYESRHIETKSVGMADSVWNNPDDGDADSVL